MRGRVRYGLLAVLLALPSVATAASAQQQPATQQQPAAGTPPVVAPQVRYKPVGCARRGTTHLYRHGPRGAKVVALGFDDGPWSDTRQFVSLLERDHARATFFLIGGQVGTRYRKLLARELRDGDTLGDHSYTHPDLVGRGDVLSQLSRTRRAIRTTTGYTPCVFRPPYGAYDSNVVSTAWGLGMATVIWDVDPTDWALPGTGTIVARVMAQVRPGSIILSHDGGGPRGETLAAYAQIIPRLRARGYRIVSVTQLLGFRPLYRRCLRACGPAAVPAPPPGGRILAGNAQGG